MRLRTWACRVGRLVQANIVLKDRRIPKQQQRGKREDFQMDGEDVSFYSHNTTSRCIDKVVRPAFLSEGTRDICCENLLLSQ